MDAKWIRLYGTLSTAALVKAFILYGGYRLGVWADNRWHIYPWGTFVGVLIGGALGITWILLVVKKLKL